MKHLLITTLLLSAMTFSISSCKKKDKEEDPTPTTTEPTVTAVTTEDFTKTIAENPANELVLGTITANGSGTLTYTLMEEATEKKAKEEAPATFVVNSSTGELKVGNRAKFDYEANTSRQVIGKVKVSNGISEAICNITITLTDVRELDMMEKAH